MKLLTILLLALFVTGCNYGGTQIDSGGGDVGITNTTTSTDVRAGGEGAEIGSVQDSSDNSDNSTTDNSDNSSAAEE